MRFPLLLFPFLLLAPGAAAQTLVKDIVPGRGSSSILKLTPADGKAFFLARTPAAGSELWVTDGTGPGTHMVKDIYPGTRSGVALSWLQMMDGILYFGAEAPGTGGELWRSDGTAAGTYLVKDMQPGSGWGFNSSWDDDHVVVNGVLYYAGLGGSLGTELFRTDGTAAGTRLLKDINPAWRSSLPRFLTRFGAGFLFRATTRSAGAEVWFSDGTAAGTRLVKDIEPGFFASDPTSFTVLGKLAVFSARTRQAGAEPWVTDGTAAGTRMLADVRPGGFGSNPGGFTVVGNRVLFVADDGTRGRELWATDGTPAGTKLVKDLNPGSTSSNPRRYAAAEGEMLFTALHPTLGEELWISDGTAGGTKLLKDLSTGSWSTRFSGRIDLVGSGLHVLFGAEATTSSEGREIWTSDGTPAGTKLLADLNPSGGSFPENFVTIGDIVLFRAFDGVRGTELWKLPLGLTGAPNLEAYGRSCPRKGPRLAGVGLPRVGGASFAVDLLGGRPNGQAALLAGAPRVRLPLGGGCEALVGLAGSVVVGPFATSAAGSARVPLPIPADPKLAGGSLGLQGVVADPFGPFLGLASLSHGLHVVVGR